MHALKKHLVGRKITGVDWRKFDDGRGNTVTDPVLYLDNGTYLTLVTQETEGGVYGIRINVHRIE